MKPGAPFESTLSKRSTPGEIAQVGRLAARVDGGRQEVAQEHPAVAIRVLGKGARGHRARVLHDADAVPLAARRSRSRRSRSTLTIGRRSVAIWRVCSRALLEVQHASRAGPRSAPGGRRAQASARRSGVRRRAGAGAAGARAPRAAHGASATAAKTSRRVIARPRRAGVDGEPVIGGWRRRRRPASRLDDGSDRAARLSAS